MMFWRLNCFQLQKLWGLRSGPEPWDLPRFQYSWNIPYSAYSTFNESINDACALHISELGNTTAVDRRSTTTATIEDTKEENNIENAIFINITLMLTDWWTGWEVNVGLNKPANMTKKTYCVFSWKHCLGNMLFALSVLKGRDILHRASSYLYHPNRVQTKQ